MMHSALMLAEGMGEYFPWYTWVAAGGLIVILVGYKMYQKKMMG